METSARLDIMTNEIASRDECLSGLQAPWATSGRSWLRAQPCDEPCTIYIVDDDAVIRNALRELLEQFEYSVECFASADDFLEAPQPCGKGCLLVDLIMPGMSGIELIRRLKASGDDMPAVVISGHATVLLAVQAMKAGAVDFIEKPFRCDALLTSVKRALAVAHRKAEQGDLRHKSPISIANLTSRQTQILGLVLAGHPSKNIAADLGISQRTVDNHRAAIMRKTSSKSIAALVQKSICALCIKGQCNDHNWTIATTPRRSPAIEHVRSVDASNEATA